MDGVLDRYSVYYAGFSSSHRQGVSHSESTTETRPHGHDWRLVVEVSGDEEDRIEYALRDIAKELHGRSLEDMMPGAATTATGIAQFVMERMALRYPGVCRVEAVCAGHHAYATREPRRTT